MNFHRTTILALTLFLAACNNSKTMEESIVIYDQKKNKAFISLLDERGVNYRIQADGLVIYPAEQKEIVKKTFEEVTGKIIPDFEPPIQK